MSTMLMATSIFFACMTSIGAWSLTDEILEMVPDKERQETEILIMAAKRNYELTKTCIRNF